MSNFHVRELDQVTLLRQFHANSGKIRYVSSPLEQVDQQASINISLLPVSQLVKMSNFFGYYLQGDCLGEPLWSLCLLTIETEEQECFFLTQEIKFRVIVGSIETRGEHLRLYFWSYSAVTYHKLKPLFNSLFNS